MRLLFQFNYGYFGYTQTDRNKTLIKKGLCMPVTKTKTFSGRVESVLHVATVNDVNLMLYGILLK